MLRKTLGLTWLISSLITAIGLRNRAITGNSVVLQMGLLRQRREQTLSDEQTKPSESEWILGFNYKSNITITT